MKSLETYYCCLSDHLENSGLNFVRELVFVNTFHYYECLVFILDNISAIAKVFGKEDVRDGKKYMSISKLVVDFVVQNSRFKVKDASNTGSVLGEAINQFLNQNANELVHEMRPAASQSIAKLFMNILDQGFSHIPIDDWLLDD